MKRLISLILGSYLFLLPITNILAAPTEPLIQALIFVESSNRPYAISKKGCRGLGQIQRETWDWICDLMGVSWSFDQAFDPHKNIQVTKYYLNWLENYLKRKGHYSLDLLLASYNAGPGSVRKYGWKVPPYPETIYYIQKVKKRLKEAK